MMTISEAIAYMIPHVYWTVREYESASRSLLVPQMTFTLELQSSHPCPERHPSSSQASASTVPPHPRPATPADHPQPRATAVYNRPKDSTAAAQASHPSSTTMASRIATRALLRSSIPQRQLSSPWRTFATTSRMMDTAGALPVRRPVGAFRGG